MAEQLHPEAERAAESAVPQPNSAGRELPESEPEVQELLGQVPVVPADPRAEAPVQDIRAVEGGVQISTKGKRAAVLQELEADEGHIHRVESPGAGQVRYNQVPEQQNAPEQRQQIPQLVRKH